MSCCLGGLVNLWVAKALLLLWGPERASHAGN